MTTNYSSTEEALYFVEDIFSRAMIPFVLLGETAKSVYENLDREVNTPIEVGITKNNLTQYGKSTLKMFLPPETEWGSKKITFTHQGTPVTIRVIHRKYSVMEKPDQVFYKITNFKIPNPFEKYWKIRGVIQ